MNHRKPALVAAALSLALCAPLALAQETTTTTDPMTQDPQATGAVTWADLDADGDGMLDAGEAAGNASLGDAFDDADADDDGMLTAPEYADWRSREAVATDAMDATDPAEPTDAETMDDATDDGSSDQDPGVDADG